MAEGMGEDYALIICLIFTSFVPIPLVISDLLADTAGGKNDR
jgi:hypothetical protein